MDHAPEVHPERPLPVAYGRFPDWRAQRDARAVAEQVRSAELVEDTLGEHVHLVAASSNGQFVEFFLDDTVLNFRRLVGRQLDFKNGDLLLPSEPGIGFDFDEKAVAKYGSGWTTVGHNSANAA